MFAGSFVLLIILGGILFKLLPGLYVDEGMSWLDAFFTATSAICVTGLIVVDTATYFTFWGQLLVLVLIQIGDWGC
jgi:trk system potassium uptake protein